jgi:hypothetical protein
LAIELYRREGVAAASSAAIKTPSLRPTGSAPNHFYFHGESGPLIRRINNLNPDCSLMLPWRKVEGRKTLFISCAQARNQPQFKPRRVEGFVPDSFRQSGSIQKHLAGHGRDGGLV